MFVIRTINIFLKMMKIFKNIGKWIMFKLQVQVGMG